MISVVVPQERYESSFLLVTGDLKKPIARKNIPLLLENLFPSFPYRFSSYNVREVLDVFGRNGITSQHIFWSDFRKIIRERKSGTTYYQSDAIFIKSALNPDSRPMKFFKRITNLAALYYFIMVPVRIAFDPWHNMLNTLALCTDLVFDAFTFLNLVVLLNTCYTNSKAAIVTNRMKILRRMNYNYLVAAIPLDWCVTYPKVLQKDIYRGLFNFYCCSIFELAV